MLSARKGAASYTWLWYETRFFSGSSGKRPVQEVARLYDPAQLLWLNRLRPVAQGFIGPVVDLHHQPVGSSGYGCFGHREHKISSAGSVAWVRYHRERCLLLDHRDGVEVQGESCLVFERPAERGDSPLAKYDLLVPLRYYALCEAQVLIDLSGESTLEEDRLAGLCGFFNQILIVHVSRPDLKDVSVLCNRVNVRLAANLCDGRDVKILADVPQVFQTVKAEPLEGVHRGSGLESTAAQDVGAGILYLLCNPAELFVTFNRTGPSDVHRRVAPANGHGPDLDDDVLCYVRPAHQSERRLDPNRVVDSGQRL